MITLHGNNIQTRLVGRVFISGAARPRCRPVMLPIRLVAARLTGVLDIHIGADHHRRWWHPGGGAAAGRILAVHEQNIVSNLGVIRLHIDYVERGRDVLRIVGETIVHVICIRSRIIVDKKFIAH